MITTCHPPAKVTTQSLCMTKYDRPWRVVSDSISKIYQFCQATHIKSVKSNWKVKLNFHIVEWTKNTAVCLKLLSDSTFTALKLTVTFVGVCCVDIVHCVSRGLDKNTLTVHRAYIYLTIYSIKHTQRWYSLCVLCFLRVQQHASSDKALHFKCALPWADENRENTLTASRSNRAWNRRLRHTFFQWKVFGSVILRGTLNNSQVEQAHKHLMENQRLKVAIRLEPAVLRLY